MSITKPKSVKLPTLPKGKEFEESISAFFQCAGYYIERNVIERGKEEVLELDIIATQYDANTIPEISLLEVKSSKWGFRELFKISGWMHHTNILNGVFVASESKRHIDFFRDKATQMGIKLIVVPDIHKSNKEIKDFLNVDEFNGIDFSNWRFSYWTARNLLKVLYERKKSATGVQRYRKMEKYYFTLNNGIFFTENIIERVEKLYSAFQEYPHLSAKCGHELIGDNFEEEHDEIPSDVYDETYYKCVFNDISISTFIEHQARLALLKNAIDYNIYKDFGNSKRTDDILKILGMEISRLDLLPSSFNEGLRELSTHKYFHKYPVFWQWFMWVFGGFLLLDYLDRDYERLSLVTGIPVDEIPNALNSYNILFPRDDGWFLDLSPESHIRMLKMFPVPFMGVGANYRRLVYTDSGKFFDLKVKGRHTLDDLLKYNRVIIKVLSI